MDEVINIIQLSPDRWKEYRYLRLEALQKDPQAFGQQYNKAINFPDSYWIDHLENTLNENKLLVFFAERDNELVGMIGAYFNSDIETENTARLFSVYVKRLFRDKGVARKLQKTLLHKLKGIEGLKMAKVQVNTLQISALNLYKQGNFKIVKTERMILGDGKEYEVATLEQVLK